MMAIPEHVRMLVNSTAAQWKAWRESRRHEPLKIMNYDLGQMRRATVTRNDGTWTDFRGFDFSSVDLRFCSMVQCDLSYASLYEVDWRNVALAGSLMHKVNGMGASFMDCHMNSVKATDARLMWSRYPRTSLHDVDLSGAILHYADFAYSDLTGAQFDGCDLSETRLIHARLACANLSSARVICGSSENYSRFDDADRAYGEAQPTPNPSLQEFLQEYEEARAVGRELQLTSPAPRHAILGNLTQMDPLVVDDIEQIRNVVQIIYDVASAGTGRGSLRLYYRGHGCKCWSLTSSLARIESDGSESDMLDELALSSPGEFRECRSELERLVLARHHGLPTRFLDVTLNALVALYFACIDSGSCDNESCDGTARLHCLITPPDIIKRHHSDTVSLFSAFTRLTRAEQLILLTEPPPTKCQTSSMPQAAHMHFSTPSYTDAMDRLRHFVAREKPYFENRIDPKDFFKVVIVEPERAFPRLRAQSGAFVMSAFHERFEADRVITVDEAMTIYGHVKFDIPPSAKARILRELEFLHINEETMFVGLDAAARAVISRHKRPAG